MKEITQERIRRIFGEDTFSKGLKYFKKGYVEKGVKKGNKLFGRVMGSAPNPYKVKVEITDKVGSECSCPVGEMCKHGVALLLQWIEERDSFIDADNLMVSLKKRDKEELVEILSSIIEENPFLASKLMFSEEIKEKKINLKAISKRIGHLLGGYLDYNEVDGVVEELNEVKKIGDELTGEGFFKDAVDVYILLIENGVNAFENGVDDSSGVLGGFIEECVENCNKNLDKLGENEKRNWIDKIMDIIAVEDYGLDTEKLLYGVATKKNMPIIDEKLLRMIPIEGESFHLEYLRRRILDLLSDLYMSLDLQMDALRVIREAGLMNKVDYLRVAETMIKQSNDMEAFEYVKEGLHLAGEGNYPLDKLYFDLLNRRLEDESRRAEVNLEETINIALRLLSPNFRPEEYDLIKEVFKKIGGYEELISSIKTKCEENVTLSVLLYDGYINDAAEYAMVTDKLYPTNIVNIAEAAKREGKTEEAIKLTLKALKQGLNSETASINELIRSFVEGSNENELKEAVGCIQNVSIAKIFVNTLFKRNQEYAVELIKRFIIKMEKEEIKKLAMKLDNRHALEIYHAWVTEFVNRSHIYYDDVVDILKMIREIADKQEWKNYSSMFMKNNAGKKKLLEKIRTTMLFPEKE